MDIQTVISDFTDQLASLIEAQVTDRARQAVTAAFQGASGLPRRRGRPPKVILVSRSVAGRPRKKPPRQLCPVPRCKNVAAPVFGMVCAKHKDLPKAKITKYRKARRAAKAGA